RPSSPKRVILFISPPRRRLLLVLHPQNRPPAVHSRADTARPFTWHSASDPLQRSSGRTYRSAGSEGAGRCFLLSGDPRRDLCGWGGMCDRPRLTSLAQVALIAELSAPPGAVVRE